MTELFIVFIVNRKFSRWEIFPNLSTVSDLFRILRTKYDIENCLLEIGDMSIIYKPSVLNSFIYNEPLKDVIRRENVNTIHITTKKPLATLKPES
jgi:hypothetical protein